MHFQYLRSEYASVMSLTPADIYTNETAGRVNVSEHKSETERGPERSCRISTEGS